MHAPSNEHTTHRLEAEVAVNAPARILFEALVDIRARAQDVPAFQRVTISDETEDGFVATMHEHYGGRDIVVVSQFRFQRPRTLSYEHVDSPYGTNKGTFTIDDHGTQCIVRQVHQTKQDVSPGTELRADWLELMGQLLSSIKRDAERRAT